LREALPAEFAGRETADHDGDGLCDEGGESETDQREAENCERDAFDKGGERPVCDESPIEMACVAEELEFVAMKSVAVIRKDVDERDYCHKGNQWQCVGSRNWCQVTRRIVELALMGWYAG
jgi:hypothetical protein